MKFIPVMIAAVACLSMVGKASAAERQNPAWDKTFPQSDMVTVEKVRFTNRVDIELVGDMYLPKNLDRAKAHPAIIVGHPFGGVKEQTAGLYAQSMAERGFVTLAIDNSFGGESGGTPRPIASPEIFVEDFSAAVDFIGTRPFVDRNRIGVIGICGSGGFVISAAQIDPRMKAEGKPVFTLDSKEPTADYKEIIENETRYSSLQRTFPERAKVLFD